MDIYPESFQIMNHTMVLSTTGRLLSASLLKVKNNAQAYVVSIHYLLMWLLCESHRYVCNRSTYRTFYRHTIEIIAVAESIYTDLSVRGDAKMQQEIVNSFATSPFAPVLSTIGNINMDSSYIIKMAANAQKMKDNPPAVLNLSPDIADILVGLPKGYYPETSAERPEFDYSANLLFRRSGEIAAE